MLNPATNQYEVSVLADSSLAIRFPEKPFGLAIEELGLAPKDSKRYAGYVLVSIEAADRESKTHSWVFQKLAGAPEWTTTSNSRENLTPQKFRSQTVVVKTEQEVAPGTAPTALTGDLVSSVVTQVPNTGKAVLTEITETIDENAEPLVGSTLFDQHGGGIATTSEELVLDENEVSAEGGFLVLSSSVDPIGNGKSVKSTTTAQAEYPLLTGQKYDERLNIAIPFSQQTVEPDANFNSTDDVTPINQWKSQVRTTDINAIRDALKQIHHIFPTQDTVSLPNTLISAKVVVSRTVGNGNSIGVGESFKMSNSSSVSVSADVDYVLEEGYGGPVPAETHIFYLESGVTTEEILAECDAKEWPRYHAISQRVVVSGHGVSKTVSTSASSNGGSISEESSVSAFTNAVSIPPALSVGGSLSIEYKDFSPPRGAADRLVSAIVERQRQIIAQISAANIPNSSTALSLASSNVTMAEDLDANSFPVQVSSGLKATNPSSIQKGRFVKDSRIQDYGYGMVQVTATVIIIK